MLTKWPDRVEYVADETITIGEIGRRLTRLEDGLRADLKAIDDRMADKLVSRDYYDGRHDALLARVGELERQWAARTARWWALVVACIGAVVTALATLIVTLVTSHP